MTTELNRFINIRLCMYLQVADCICLMSLGFPATIPVDTHIHQVAKTYLPHLTKAKTLNDKVYSEITTFFKELYGPYAGWAHSVSKLNELYLHTIVLFRSTT